MNTTFTKESRARAIVLLLSGAALSMLPCSPSRSGYMSERIGSDKRWQEYAKTRQDPYKEIVLPYICADVYFTLSPDHQKALCGDFEPYTYLIDMNSANVLATLGINLGCNSIQCADFSSDGKRAISAGGTYHHMDRSFLDRVRGKPIKKDWALYFWDLSTGKEIGQVKGQDDYVRAVAYSPVSETALSGGAQGDILLCNLDNMQVLKRFVGHSSGIRPDCLTWAQDGKRFLSGSWDGSVRLWDVETGKEIAHLQPGYGRVMSLALSPDGRYALSSYLNGPHQPVIYWDLETQKEINRFGVPGNPRYTDHHQQLYVASVAFLPDGKTALFGLVFGTVIWWDLNKWELIAMNRLHQRELLFVAFSLDGKSSISAGNDSETDRRAKVRFWQLPARPNAPIGSGESSPASELQTSMPSP